MTEEKGSFLKSRTAQMIFLAWMILGFVAFVGACLIYKPWTPLLGPGRDPRRYPLNALWCLGVSLPVALLCVNYYIKHNEWLAPRGAYQPGRVYKIWTTERYVGIAISCAFFVMCGVASPGAAIDFPWAGVTFASVYFGVIEGFLGVGVLGFILRGLVWGLSPRTFYVLWNDVALCSLIAVFYRGVLERNEREKGGIWKNEGFLFAVYTVFHYLAYWFCWDTGMLVSSYPIPELYARLAYLVGWWTFTGISSAAAAFLVTRQLIKVVERRQRQAQQIS